MRNLSAFIPACVLIFSFGLLSACVPKENSQDTWISLFNGEDLDGWTANENPESFRVEDGAIVANGQRSHLFYTGQVSDANFKNFEFKAKVLTRPMANSGIYIHTKFQEEGWPSIGYECQVNSTHINGDGGDYLELKKMGSLYQIRNTYKILINDDIWFDYYIKVQGKNIQVKINDLKVVDYTEPENPTRANGPADRVLSSGTFALQGHDPGSTVLFKDIYVKILGDSTVANDNPVIQNETYEEMMSMQFNQFSFTDLSVSVGEDFNLDEAMSFYYRTGINLGIVIDLYGDESQNIENLIPNHVNKLQPYPVFIGVKVDAGTRNEAFSDVDYVMGTAGAFEFEGSDSEDFMNQFVANIVEDLEQSSINVWAASTKLPESLQNEYNALWTTERMMSVINAAKSKNIAIEIDNEAKTPSIEFIKLAKENGLKFTYGHLGINSEMGSLDYIFEVIKACNLNYKDNFIP